MGRGGRASRARDKIFTKNSFNQKGFWDRCLSLNPNKASIHFTIKKYGILRFVVVREYCVCNQYFNALGTDRLLEMDVAMLRGGRSLKSQLHSTRGTAEIPHQRPSRRSQQTSLSCLPEGNNYSNPVWEETDSGGGEVNVLTFRHETKDAKYNHDGEKILWNPKKENVQAPSPNSPQIY